MFYSISETALLSELRVLVFAGPSDDPKGKSGCTWVALNCLLADPGLREFCQKRHVKISIDIRESVCVVKASTPPEHLEPLINRLHDALLIIKPTQLLCESSLFAAKRNIMIKERQPITHLIGLARQYLFKSHRWGNIPHGTQEDIATITRKDILDFQMLIQQRARAIFFCTQQEWPAASLMASPLHAPEREICLPEAPKPPSVNDIDDTVFCFLPHIEQAHILIVNITHNGPGPASINHQIANDILGGPHYDSLLVEILRRRLGLVYTTHSFQLLSPVAHLWCIHAECSPEHAIKVIENVYHILENIQNIVGIDALDTAWQRYLLQQHFIWDTPLKKLERQMDLCAIIGSFSVPKAEEEAKASLPNIINIFRGYLETRPKAFVLNACGKRSNNL